jgi:multiple sugar transport system permease protein
VVAVLTDRKPHRPRPSARSRPAVAAAYVALAIAAFISIFPLYWILVTSFKTRADAFAIPPKWLFEPTLENYSAILFGGGGWTGTPVAGLLGHSFVTSAGATVLVLITGCMAGYSFARWRRAYSRHIAVWMLSTRIFPPAAVAVPIFLMMQSLDLVDTYPGLILIYTAINLPFAIWLLQSFFRQIPFELEEAAMLDGAGAFAAFRRVVLPLAAPGIAATAIFVWIQCWNEFLFALLLTRSLKTAPVSVTDFITLYGIQWGQLSAQACLMAIPPLVLALAVQKHFVRGLTMGAVK